MPSGSNRRGFVIQRAAAKALGPQILRMINDPSLAPEIAALLVDQLKRRDGAAAAVGRFASDIRVRSLPSKALGRVKARTL